MDHKLNRRTLSKTAGAVAGVTALGRLAPARAQDATPAADFPVLQIPEGYQIEKVVDGLTFPTGLTWDDEGQMYVAEAGGAFLDLGAPSRILRVSDDGEVSEAVNLTEAIGTVASVVGLA